LITLIDQMLLHQLIPIHRVDNHCITSENDQVKNPARARV